MICTDPNVGWNGWGTSPTSLFFLISVNKNEKIITVHIFFSINTIEGCITVWCELANLLTSL